jgi:hypothetical protein
VSRLPVESDRPTWLSERVVRIVRILRVEASGSYSRATYADMCGATAGPGFSLFDDALDLSVYYRSTVLRYRSIPEWLKQQAIGGALVVVPSSEILLAAQGEAIDGSDTKALALFATVTWRPSL